MVLQKSSIEGMAHPLFTGGSSQVLTEEPAADTAAITLDSPQVGRPDGELVAPGPATPALALAEPSALPACEVRPAEPACEEPVGTVPEVAPAPTLSAPVVASPAQLCPEATPPKETQNEVDSAEDVTNKRRTVPVLIVPPNWDVPIHQKMVDIFALSKKPEASPAKSAEGDDVVVVDEIDGSDCQQAKCPDELDVENEDGEPPVTLRREQWTLRPKTSRGRGKGRGRGRGRGKQPVDPGVVQSSGEEAEAEMVPVADVKPKRPRAKAKTTKSQKEKPPRKEKPAAPKAAPKRRGKKNAEKAVVSAEADAMENNGDKEVKQTAAVDNHGDEDGGWGCLFVLASVQWSNR